VVAGPAREDDGARFTVQGRRARAGGRIAVAISTPARKGVGCVLVRESVSHHVFGNPFPRTPQSSPREQLSTFLNPRPLAV
jgi:hypothetical protein